MEEPAIVPAEAPLIIAARHLAGEYRNTAATLQGLVDFNQDVYLAGSNHPSALGVPLPRSLLDPHKEFCAILNASISKLEELAEGIEAWADDIERTIRDVLRQAKRQAQNRSSPY